MTFLYMQGFEGFSSTGNRTALDVEFDFVEEAGTGEAGITTGRTGGRAAFVDEGNTVESALRLPVSHLSSQDDWIVGLAFKTVYNHYRAFFIDPPVLEFRNFNDARLLAIIPESGTLRAVNGSGTVLGVADIGIVTNVWFYLEVKVKFHGSTGTLNMRLNEQPNVLNLTNVNTIGTSSVTRPSMIWFGNSGEQVRTEVDDIYVLDDQGSQHNDYLGDGAIRRLSPTGAGNSTQFTVFGAASNWDAVNDSDPDSDTTYVESRTAAQKDTYTFEDISDTPAAIEAVAVKSFVKKSDAGSRSFVHVARSSGTESDSAVIYPSAITYRHLASIYPQDPNTSAAWTKAGVNAAEFGFKVNA